jgi:multiple sugar transport system permease protein
MQAVSSTMRRRGRGLHTRKILAGYLFVAPSLCVLAVFVIWPIIQAIWMSFNNVDFLDQTSSFTGLSNYQQLASDSRFWNALRNTALYTAAVVPIGIILSLLAALALAQPVRGRSLFRAAFFLPVVSSFAVVAIVWQFLLNQDIGILAYWSRLAHLPAAAWLNSPVWALPAVIMVGIWKSLGFNMVILLAGLLGIPDTYYEAAEIDGAGGFARFFQITLPLLRPTSLFVLIISIIGSFQVFDQVYVMTRGGPLFSTDTIVSYLYHQGFELYQMGYASAIACVLFVILLIVTFLQLKFLRYNDVD